MSFCFPTKQLALLLTCGLSWSGVLAQTTPTTLPTEAQKVAQSVRPEAIQAHMRYLADDKLRGRKPGTPGYEMAAQYVEEQFRKLNFQPIGEKGTYRQAVPLRKGQVKESGSSMALVRDGRQFPLVYGRNFILSPNFNAPTSEVEAPIVFVGFGISAPELGYDDYAKVDVKGKIVACFNGAPTVFPSNQRAYYSSAKQEMAVAHGAVGVLMFSLPTDIRMRIEMAGPRARQAVYRWVDKQGQAQRTFPDLKAAAVLSDSTARSLFTGTAKSFEEAMAVAHRSMPQGFPLNSSVRIRTQTELNDDLIGENVMGVLPGSDPALKNEYVVYVSHLDHLGVGRPVKGDSIYNGAHDNASGVAINLEAARLFASLPKAPRRSIIFVGVTGEEMGLLGSDYFASNPTIPQDKIVANLCLDMPFFFHPLLDIVPYGAQHSSMIREVQAAANFVGVQIADDPIPEQAVFMRSDHFSFVRQGIPAIYVKSGSQTGNPQLDGTKLNLDWRATIYHSPQDEIDQPFDYNAAAKHVQLQFLIGYLTAQADQRPVWNEGDFFGTKFGKRKEVK
ncbi:peptidase M28 [Fibrisoma limi BUZ 3]|uniref:Peptidase M28 n=1 Tax=Fibrisoma limi BUZ 3 TaxID=1185876 RepID=I2GFZ5_9BACT|nr:M28 family metallopeptidase [Fibrisoma limi]CCH52820.1 peptidase M28 [Fibrisoma limi BUZ 3]